MHQSKLQQLEPCVQQTNGASLEFQDFPKTYEIRTSNGHVVQIEADKYLQTKKGVRFGRPFGTCALRALDPGVETPGLFSFVPDTVVTVIQPPANWPVV